MGIMSCKWLHHILTVKEQESYKHLECNQHLIQKALRCKSANANVHRDVDLTVTNVDLLFKKQEVRPHSQSLKYFSVNSL